jgi:Na+-translocating ferredoxin:NAD+ oxidoreductase RnfE subunit
MTGINKSTAIDRIHERIAGEGIPDQETLMEWAVEETLRTIAEYTDSAKTHFKILSPGSEVALGVLLAEMKRDFEIHE